MSNEDTVRKAIRASQHAEATVVIDDAPGLHRALAAACDDYNLGEYWGPDWRIKVRA